MINDISYYLIAEAIEYYKLRGFKYTEVPWVVSSEAINATCPVHSQKANDEQLVASGEQSFIELRMKSKLDVGKYVCATPCYRPQDAGRSNMHHSQFFKVELIHLSGDDKPSEQDYDNLINNAFAFMSRYKSNISIVETKDDERHECETLISHDIETQDIIELGSYGVRYHKKVGYWIYGTGLALPRFQQIKMLI